MNSDNLISELIQDAVIFDADGTLIDSLEIFYSTNRDYIERQTGKPFKYQTNEAFILSLPRSFEQILAEHGLSSDHVVPITAEYSARYVESAKIFPWVVELVGKLKAIDKKMAICTNNHARLIAPVLGDHYAHFDPVICGVDFGLRKPAPEFYLQLQTIGGIDLSTARYLTDEHGDAIAAKKAGIDVVYLVTWGGMIRYEDIQDARANQIGIVDDPSMIFDLVY